MARHVERFTEVTPTDIKVIGTHMPNFGPNFEYPLLKIVGGPISNRVCIRKPWPLSSIWKNLTWQHPLRAEIWSSEIVDFGGSKFTCPTLLLVRGSLPDFLWPNM